MGWWTGGGVVVVAIVKAAWPTFVAYLLFGPWCAFIVAVGVFLGALDENPVRPDVARRRVIPTAVKQEVWKRDGGRCVVCEATDELHFDHVIPFSRGGTSLVAENVQLLCARHNIEKHDRIL
ncbi:MAG: HNH endonuclease signature motif containing protein [bacterium]|nr:HNH endonuclease signature motif containing protein [bacterium]